MRSEQKKSLVIEGAKLIFKNFSGKETQFNRKGDRNFGVIIDDPAAVKQLIDNGWNVKKWVPKNADEGTEPVRYIKVQVGYKEGTRPPRIILVTSKTKTMLDSETVDQLDWAEIINVDIEINPYPWNIGGKEGVAAYVKTMYVTIEEDVFADKYMNIGIDDIEDEIPV